MQTTPSPITNLGPTPLIGTKRYKMWSTNVGAYFIIDVAMPSPLIPSKRPYPVLFVTDGNICFPAAASLSNALSMEPNGPPLQCVVGIGYEVSGNGEHAEHHVTRTRDLTPCEDKRFEMMMRSAPPPFTWRKDITPGGAGNFLAFLLEELSPWLNDTFDVDLYDTGLVGISLGGLFVLNTLFTQPEAFNRYIAISPAIWWADRCILELEKSSIRHVDGSKPSIFMAVGELEEAADAHAKMVSNFEKMTQNLDNRDTGKLEITHVILPGESHMSVFSPALSRAFRSIFSHQSRDEGWANLDND